MNQAQLLQQAKSLQFQLKKTRAIAEQSVIPDWREYHQLSASFFQVMKDLIVSGMTLVEVAQKIHQGTAVN